MWYFVSKINFATVVSWYFFPRSRLLPFSAAGIETNSNFCRANWVPASNRSTRYGSNVNWPFVTSQWNINGDHIKGGNRGRSVAIMGNGKHEWPQPSGACLYLTRRENRSAFPSNIIFHKITIIAFDHVTSFPGTFPVNRPEERVRTGRTVLCHFTRENKHYCKSRRANNVPGKTFVSAKENRHISSVSRELPAIMQISAFLWTEKSKYCTLNTLYDDVEDDKKYERFRAEQEGKRFGEIIYTAKIARN